MTRLDRAVQSNRKDAAIWASLVVEHVSNLDRRRRGQAMGPRATTWRNFLHKPYFGINLDYWTPWRRPWTLQQWSLVRDSAQAYFTMIPAPQQTMSQHQTGFSCLKTGCGRLARLARQEGNLHTYLLITLPAWRREKSSPGGLIDLAQMEHSTLKFNWNTLQLSQFWRTSGRVGPAAADPVARVRPRETDQVSPPSTTLTAYPMGNVKVRWWLNLSCYPISLCKISYHMGR